MSNAYMSHRAMEPLKEYLASNGITVHTITGEGSKVDSRIADHADLYMCQLGLGKDATLFMGDETRPCAPYPHDAVYNATTCGRYFIHNLDITDPKLLEHAKACGLSPLHVKQGYSRCSCLPIAEGVFLTSDGGMNKVLSNAGADTLLISTGNVVLEGFPYGFIGGACGNVLIDDQPVLVFNGDLCMHPDADAIVDFAEQHNVKIKYFEGHPLEDIGSILYSYK